MSKDYFGSIATQTLLLARNILDVDDQIKSRASDPSIVEVEFEGPDRNLFIFAHTLILAGGVLKECRDAKFIQLVPNSVITKLNNISIGLNSEWQLFLKKCKTSISAHGELASIDATQFQFKFSDGFIESYQDEYKKITSLFDQFLAVFNQIAPIISLSKRKFSFQEFLKKVDERTKITASELVKIREARQEYEKVTEKVGGLATVAGQKINKIEEIEEEIRKKAQHIDQTQSHCQSQVNEINAIFENISKTELEIKSIEREVNLTRDNIVKDQDTIDKQTAQIHDLIIEVNDSQQKIKENIEKANRMLSVSTVAGLGEIFAEKTKKLSYELIWIHISFYVGIVFLLFLSIPLIIYAFIPIADYFEWLLPQALQPIEIERSVTAATDAINIWQYLSEIGLRFLVLLPALLFLAMVSRRQKFVFLLREQYSYKYAMAVAVDGFQKQAPQYKEQIDALVLEEIAFNPADKLKMKAEFPVRRGVFRRLFGSLYKQGLEDK